MWGEGGHLGGGVNEQRENILTGMDNSVVIAERRGYKGTKW